MLSRAAVSHHIERTVVLLVSSSTEGHLSCFPFGILQIKLLWTFMYKSLLRHLFLFLLGKLSRSWMAGPYSGYILILYELPNCFPKWFSHSTPLSAVHESSCCSLPSPAHAVSTSRLCFSDDADDCFINLFAIYIYIIWWRASSELSNLS